MNPLPRRRSRRLAALCLGALAALLLAPPLRAQVAGEAELKAEWVRRFALFTEWPAGALPPGVPMQLCVQGRDEAMHRALAALDGQPLRGNPLNVRTVLAAEDVRGCHLLYLADHDARRLFPVAAGAATLTIGDVEGFALAGGAIGLVRENARLRFEVNRASAQRAGLKLGSELLKNARLVVDSPLAQR